MIVVIVRYFYYQDIVHIDNIKEQIAILFATISVQGVHVIVQVNIVQLPLKSI